MKLPLPRLLLLGFLALAAACPNTAKPSNGLSCYPVPEGPMAFLNGFACFETPAECDANRALPSAMPEPAPGACQSSGPPRWHCFTSRPNARDPLGPGSTCYPTQAMCQASRPTLEGMVVSECIAADHVYCSTGSTGGVTCSGEEDFCRRVDEMVRRTVVSLGKPRSVCARR